MLPTIQTFLSNFVSAYGKHYSANHVLISLTKNLEKNLENNKIVGIVLTDWSKAFYCIPHHLLVAKMEAYGFSEDLLFYIHTWSVENIRKH